MKFDVGVFDEKSSKHEFRENRLSGIRTLGIHVAWNFTTCRPASSLRRFEGTLGLQQILFFTDSFNLLTPSGFFTHHKV